MFWKLCAISVIFLRVVSWQSATEGAECTARHAPAEVKS
jgi:hypothetical protein